MNIEQFAMKDWIIHWVRLDLITPLLMLLCIVGALLAYRMRMTERMVDCLAPGEQRKLLLVNYSFIKKIIKFGLFFLGMVFLCIALLRPQWNEIDMPIAQQGRDVLIALDVSRSMLAQDIKPDRLHYAKNKIKQLLKQLKTERAGLILFSGSTFVQCPLTSDLGAFYMFLDAIDVETISSGTTAIDQAVQEAICVFEKMAERKSKLLVVFTDGEDFSSNLASIKKKAAAIGLHIVTVGVGTQEGAPIPLYDHRGKQNGHQLDAKDNVVISRLNEGILHRLAEDTGGIYVPISTDDTDIKNIKDFIYSFERETLHDKQCKRYQEQYQWPLLFSFICLVIEWLL